MSKERMVTRTIKSTNFRIMCLDIVVGKAYEDAVNIAGRFKKVEDAEKAISSAYNTEGKKFVHIIESKEVENLYGMTEKKFLDMAEILPERAKETNDNNTDKE